MSSPPKIPDPETRALSIANLRAVVKHWDRLIADLDELNARLAQDIPNHPFLGDRFQG